MAKRLGAKNKKRTLDKARAYKEGTAPKKHKIDKARSKKAKKKKANPAK